MSLQESFNASVEKTKEFTQRPSNDELLNLYALFKQATDGDVVGERPGGFDFKAIAKYDAWADQKGKSNEDAMQEYISFVKDLESKYI